MRWRTYDEIIDKLCAWSNVQRSLTYMADLCVSSKSCSTLAPCQDIWKPNPKTHGMSSCLQYLGNVLNESVFNTLEDIVTRAILEPCLSNPKLSELTIEDPYNIVWRIMHKNLINGKNQLMFFRNQNDDIHISIPESWNMRTGLHVSFDEMGKHYRLFRNVAIDADNELSFSWGKAVVVIKDSEHHVKLTPQQRKKCEDIFIDFVLFQDTLGIWQCDEHNRDNQIRTPQKMHGGAKLAQSLARDHLVAKTEKRLML